MGAWNTARNYIQWTLDYIKAENREVTILEENLPHLLLQDI